MPDIDCRAAQTLQLSGYCTHVNLWFTCLQVLGCDPVDPAISYGVVHLVSTDYRIIPVCDIKGSVCSKSNVTGAEPFVRLSVPCRVVPNVPGIVFPERRQKVLTLPQLIARPLFFR